MAAIHLGDRGLGLGRGQPLTNQRGGKEGRARPQQLAAALSIAEGFVLVATARAHPFCHLGGPHNP